MKDKLLSISTASRFLGRGPICFLALILSLSAETQTTTIDAPKELTDINSENDYVFSDVTDTSDASESNPQSFNSTLSSKIDSAITMNSLKIGGGHVFVFGHRILTITSGNLSFDSTGLRRDYTGLWGGELESGTSNLNITNNLSSVQLMTAIAGTCGVTYSGTGTIGVAKNSTYTGGTIINARVEAGPVNSLSTEAVTINEYGTLMTIQPNINISSLILSGGTLAMGKVGEDKLLEQTSIGALKVTCDSLIDFVSPKEEKYAFADSSQESWSGNLTLKGFMIGTDSIRFGTNAKALTADQKSRIRLKGASDKRFDLDSNGYLILKSL